MTEPPSSHSYLLLHGWQNHRPTDHWQNWLATELSNVGAEVAYPQLPDPDEPDLEHWLSELQRQLQSLTGQTRTVICHSLACALWLHAVAREVVPVGIHRVLMVAPPSSSFLQQHAGVMEFASPPTTSAQLAAAAQHTLIVASDNDPCNREGATATFGKPLNCGVSLLPEAGHLSIPDGYGPWPSVLDWCLGTAAEPSANRRTFGET
ncbi:alpha/beta hydrolase [Streptomyces sp. Je 1-332]|uniref:RBBP9/YdeN family alpha/beta hydrolase n=1 Tax=Streptomyces sp. Je 1-332 TaxID=3231270 RepID=UPI003457E17A